MRNLAKPIRSQRYAQMVFDQVSRHKQELINDKELKRYGALCHRFPVLVLRSGLAQALGFLQAKAKDKSASGDRYFLDDLTELLEISLPEDIYAANADLHAYRRLTREALAASVWYKRFAQSVLGIDPTEQGED